MDTILQALMCTKENETWLNTNALIADFVFKNYNFYRYYRNLS